MKWFKKMPSHVTGGATPLAWGQRVWAGGGGNLGEPDGGQPGSWKAVPRMHSNSEHVMEEKKNQNKTLDRLSKHQLMENDHGPHLQEFIPELGGGGARTSLIWFAIPSSAKRKENSFGKVVHAGGMGE